MQRSAILFALIPFLVPNSLFSQKNDLLKKQITEIAKSLKADIGIAVMDLQDNLDTVSFNGQRHFPMQSVYKFHLGLAILHQVDEGKLSLDQKIHIDKKDYFPTWSPLMKKYPEGNVDVALREVLMFTASQSDNLGCDILFRLVGGAPEVGKYINSLGIKDVAILNTEKEMHDDANLQFKNWTTPIAMVQILEKFYRQDLFPKEGYDFMWGAMVETPMGSKRIKGMLPAGTIVAHRTGTGGLIAEGILGAVNDVGFINLPNGKTIALAVFIASTKEDQATNEEAIAKISKVVYEFYNL
jgi:beta-lactamase class A